MQTKAVTFDKAAWGDGPWQSEPDRLDFEHVGLPCLLHRGPGGHWCGYAAVPTGHPLHGKGYGDDGVDVDVHGGLTYASACAGAICHTPKPGEPDDVWWFGFDCAHSGDYSPKHGNYGVGTGYPWPDKPYDHERAMAAVDWRVEKYRDVAYVRAETERLAEQLVALRYCAACQQPFTGLEQCPMCISFVDKSPARSAPTGDTPPPACDCGSPLTQCSSCAVADWQAAHPECETCCPVRGDACLPGTPSPSASDALRLQPPPDNDDDHDDGVPLGVRQELMRCATSNGRISYYYLCDLWRRGSDEGYGRGYGDGLDEGSGDPRVEQIEDGFKAIQSATNGEYSAEDRVVLSALQAGREFAVRLANREKHIAQLIAERTQNADAT
jgi:hypothetical protein